MGIEIPQIEREKDTFEVQMSFKDLQVSKNEIIRSLGYTDGTMPMHFEKIIDDILAQLSEHCKIQAGYRLLDAKKQEDRHDGLFVGSTFFKLQKLVTSQFRKAQKAVLFVCTIGPAMETWAKKLSVEGDLTLSYLVDTVASVTVEQATDVLHDHIEKQMHVRGLKITNRYSPGYCDWSVSEQHLLFSSLPVNFCGITLTESALMVPIESVSGIIGVGKAVKRVDYTCDTCGMKDCTYRTFRIAKAKRSEYNL